MSDMKESRAGVEEAQVQEQPQDQDQAQEAQEPQTEEQKRKVWDETYQALKDEADKKDAQIVHGTLELECPILSRGEELKEIDYDFSQITIEALTEAMDKHMGQNPAMMIAGQQFAVFALACRGYKGLDEKDITDRMQAEDSFAATIIGGEYLDHLENQGYLRTISHLKDQEALKGMYKYGTIELKKPVEGPDGVVKELPYNFAKLAGSKYTEVLSALSRTQAGFSYKQARRLFMEAVKIASGWNDLALKKIENELCLEDIFSGQRVAIGFFIGTYLGARKRMKPRR